MIDSSGIRTRKRGHNRTTRFAFHTSAASPNNLYLTRTRPNAFHAGPMMPMQTLKMLLKDPTSAPPRKEPQHVPDPSIAGLSFASSPLSRTRLPGHWAPISHPRSNPSPYATHSHQLRHHLHRSMRLSVSMTHGVSIKITQTILAISRRDPSESGNRSADTVGRIDTRSCNYRTDLAMIHFFSGAKC